MKFSKFHILFLFGVTLCGIQAEEVNDHVDLLNLVNFIVDGTKKAVPKLKGFYQLTKMKIASYPFELASSMINSMCSSMTAPGNMPRVLPDVNKMFFQLRTACEKIHFHFINADEMLQSSHFDPKKKVVILATGWKTTVNDSRTIDELTKAYMCRGDVNFVAVDVAVFVNNFYAYAALNTNEIGEHVANGLVVLTKVVPLENIHLIGHSLGAHIVGVAGRHFTILTGKRLPRITGLDPARPCFNEGEHLSGLSRGDADFVDVIHSNSGALGQSDAVGDVDFYPGGSGSLTPGCMTIICAHQRAWEYYAESVYPGNEMNFLAKRCTSLNSLIHAKCQGLEFPMGYATPANLAGSYFLDVNKNAPFGKNVTMGRYTANEKCGSCDIKSEIINI